MFRKRREPILTATTCEVVERLRLAIEVLTGSRVRIVQFDFNSGYGQVCAGEEIKDIALSHESKDLFHFSFGRGGGEDWYTARFDKPWEARVINEHHPEKRDGHPMWWVGSSIADRHMESLYL